jgi:Na+/H+ antiporter NhaD/arsenite permease-like protein
MKRTRKFLQELLTVIQQGTNLAEVATVVQSELEKSHEISIKFKEYSKYAALVASIIINIMQALGVWM